MTRTWIGKSAEASTVETFLTSGGAPRGRVARAPRVGRGGPPPPPHERVVAEERAHGLWDDAFRQEFTRLHAQYAAPVADFTERGVERYTSFIALKRHQVEEYLRGR